MIKLKLNPVEILNLNFASEIFDRDFLAPYYEHLDFSGADNLCAKANAICGWYKEVVINHTYFLKNFLNEYLQKSDGEQLLIFLAAGKSPLSLEILKCNYDKIFRVIELDNDDMYEKKELYDKCYPELSSKIKCLNADIKAGSILSTLNLVLSEYFNEVPCVVVFEKIIHYLKPTEFENIVSSFKSSEHQNIFIVEYLIPRHLLSKEYADIPDKLYKLLNSYTETKVINSYTENEIKGLFSHCGGELLLHQTMLEIELKRVGSNKHFLKKEDGWLECAAWKI